MALRFDGRVVIVTGAGGSLGASYVKAFASRGAKVVVNDLSKESADKVVREIQAAGGEAIADYHGVAQGDLVVKAALDKWGRVDVLINNAGILRDKSFKNMTEKEFDDIYEVHLRGAFLISKAAWPVMRKQKYGRILTTSSAAGIYGSFGQANYSAAKFGLISFAKTLGREGFKYGIQANAIAPFAASPMTATVKPKHELEQMSPDFVAPVVLYLCHESCKENSALFECGAGYTGKLRWETSKGVIFTTDDTFTPSAVGARWAEVNDYRGGRHPESIQEDNLKSMFGQPAGAKPNPQGPKIDYSGQVALVTGAGAGVGRGHALMYAKHGAAVVVNDMAKANADKVVEEIKAMGGKAVANYSSVENGKDLVDTAIKHFGGIHIVVNNAGILRDKSFAGLSEADWDIIWRVHLRGTFAVCHAAWPYLVKQKYGRILNTASQVCIHGNFGQLNYATMKGAIAGMTKALALEGKKYNILANVLLPTGGTQLTATVWKPEMMKIWDPAYNAPLVGYVTSPANTETTGQIYATTGGGCSAYRWERSYGYAFPVNKITPEAVADKWDAITRFDGRSTHPQFARDSILQMQANFGNTEEFGWGSTYDPLDVEIVQKAKAKSGQTESTYDNRDVILYNLGLGAKETELPYVYELDPKFHVIPSYGVIPLATAYRVLPPDWLPNFNYGKLLHGEQYLAIHGDVPTNATLVNKAKLLEVLDKGKAAVTTVATESRDKKTGKLLFSGITTLFIRDAGGFGGRKTGADFGAVTAVNKPPARNADNVLTVKTEQKQAAIYRLSGDYNPLHIDPKRSRVGGFEVPILHGLCTFGIATKSIVEAYGPIKDIKVRFSGSVYPGETLEISTWKDGKSVIFVVKVVERKTVVISNAAVTLA